MAEKGFGVKEVNLIGASGTPTITSPNNLNLNANNVAISTNVSIGGTLSVTGNVSVGGTLTYEDVTNIDSVGIITARSVIQAGAGLTVVGVSTFNDDVHLGLYNVGNPKIHFDESGDLLWFKKQTAGGSSSKIGLGGGTSYDHLQLQQTYTGGGQSEITAYNSNILIATNTSGKNITVQSSNDLTLANGVYPFIKGEKNSGSDQSVTLYYGQTGSTPYANPKLQTTNTGITVTGDVGAGTFTGSGASLTTLNASQLTSGTIPDARFPSTLPAVSGANLTNIAAPVEAPVANFTITSSGSSAYRISGGGLEPTANNPDIYLIRGQKYRFNNTTGSAHPFQFRLTSSGSAYTDGITGDQNGVQFFTPDNTTPSKLFYICTLHSAMVGNIYVRGANGGNENVGVTTLTSSATLHTNRILPVGGAPSGGGGGIIQVKQTVDNTTETITDTNYNDAGSLSVSITPKFSSSKILIMATTNVQTFRNNQETTGGLRLLRDSTEIIEYPYAFVLECGTSTNGRIFYNTNHSATYLDSPNTTSAVTYKVQLKVYGTSNNNRLSYNQNSSKSTILVMEVSG